jgi:hypothetical protein
MNRWQVVLLVLGVVAASWLIPAVILGYALGGVSGSLARAVEYHDE